MIYTNHILFLALILLYILLFGMLFQINMLNYILLIVYTITVIYLICCNYYINRRYITNSEVVKILDQNFLFSILSIMMTIHIIFIKYKNNHYREDRKILIQDLTILNDQKNDLKKQLNKNILSVHIKKYYIEKLLSESYECPICLDNIEKESHVFLTLCGHLFHHECLNEAMSFRSKCPTCRRHIYFNKNENQQETYLTS